MEEIIKCMESMKCIKKFVIISLLFVLAGSILAQNQQKAGNAADKILNLDPNLRFGRLDNGMTYYIHHTDWQKGQADFYYVRNVGSMQEEDHQRGYVRFLEHLALRSSKNFPSKSGIKGFTEKKGIKTAFCTGFDETVYKLKDVPVTRQELIDSCLLIMHDWSSSLLFEDDVIEEERRAVREESRKGYTPQLRLMEQQLPTLYPQSKYGVRLPLGIMGIIENFPKNDFIDFYKKWQIGGLQSIVIVGDIDVDKVEEKVKKIFSTIPKTTTEATKELYVVTDNEFPIISIAKDYEDKNTTLTIYYKHDNLPLNFKGTIADFINNYSIEVVNEVMNERFAALLADPNAPFFSASACDKDYIVSKTKGAWTSTCHIKPNELENALKALLAQTELLKKSGITDHEYERAKAKILKTYESANKRITNSSLADKYVKKFVNGDYMPEVEDEYESLQKYSALLSTEGINVFIKNIFKDHDYKKNMVISLTGAEDGDLQHITEDQIVELYINTCDEIVGIKKELENVILIPQLPEKGKIVSEKEDDLFGTTIFTLSNGVKVVLKPTEFKQNQILMSAISPGGTTMFKDEKDSWNINMLNTAIRMTGLGELNGSKLMNYFGYNNISFKAGLSPSSEIINGEATPSSLKTLFEIIYLQFTGIRSDEELFNASQETLRNQLVVENKKPEVIFRDTFNIALFGNNPRSNQIKEADFDNINYNRIIEMYKERFADASDFVFTFTGDFDIQSIRPLVEQYIATLPSLNRKDVSDESQLVPYNKGKIVKHFPVKTTKPVTSIVLMYSGKMTYNLKNIITAQCLNTMLDFIYLGKLGSYYGYSIAEPLIYVDLYNFPEGRTNLQIFVESSPEKQNEILETLKTEITKIAEEGAMEEVLLRAFSTILKKKNEIVNQNDYWMNIISSYYTDNFDSHTDYEKVLKSITIEDIKSFTKELLNQGNVMELMMYPE